MINMTVERPKDMLVIAQLVNILNIHRDKLARLQKAYAHAVFFDKNRANELMNEILETSGTIKSCMNCQDLLISANN